MKEIKLNAQTLWFLQWLDNFNDRKFFNFYKDMYLEIKEQFEYFVQSLIDEISKFDSSIKNEKAKNCVFRIYKDCRRPLNRERPYKINLWALISMDWKNSQYPWYYLHIQNNQSFFAVWTRKPKPIVAYKIRENIYKNRNKFQEILNKKEFSKTFWKLKDFPDKLKKPNRNSKYSKILWNIPDKDPSLNTISFKSRIVSKKLPDSKLLKTDLLWDCVEISKIAFDFKEFLSDI